MAMEPPTNSDIKLIKRIQDTLESSLSNFSRNSFTTTFRFKVTVHTVLL